MTTQLRYFIGAAAGFALAVLLMGFAGSGSLFARDSATPTPESLVAQPLPVQPAAIRTVSTAPRRVATRRAAAAPQLSDSSAQKSSTETPKRSWKKTALVIGGSTAAGAGVGGIVDGKKGALIGAAIGGGAGAIYEAIKRKD